MQLLGCLRIAGNERTEVSQNIRLDDGVTNGAGNVVRYVHLLSSERPEGIIWVEFDHTEVGCKMRSENRHLCRQGIQPSWTPIKPVCVTFFVGRRKAVQIVRKQFPVTLKLKLLLIFIPGEPFLVALVGLLQLRDYT